MFFFFSFFLFCFLVGHMINTFPHHRGPKNEQISNFKKGEGGYIMDESRECVRIYVQFYS